MYQVKEIFYSLQGEGVRSGRPAVFCRFSGCNLWSGKQDDKYDAICDFCDTDFITDVKQYSEDELVSAILEAYGDFTPEHKTEFQMADESHSFSDLGGLMWTSMGLLTAPPMAYLIFTGGEPALQLTQSLISKLKEYRIEIAVETNGTMTLPSGIDWVTVSPKAGTTLKILEGQELKLVYPQNNLNPQSYANLKFENFILMPKDEQDLTRNIENTKLTQEFCMNNPSWRMGIQMHKFYNFK